MWYTERLVNGKWCRIAPWGNVDNAIDSAEFLGSLCNIETRVVTTDGAQVWPAVEPAGQEETTMTPVPLSSVPSTGIFVYQTSKATANGLNFDAWHVAVEVEERRTYAQGPFRTRDQAEEEALRVQPMYPSLPIFEIVPG